MIDWTEICCAAEVEPAKISVTATRQQDLLTDLAVRLESREGFSIATLNLDHLVKFRRDHNFLHAYAAHSHVTADGNPIVWLERLSGRQVDLIPGSDLIEPVAALAARLGIPVALVGATETALNGATATLVTQHPGLQVVARISPPMGFDPTGETAQTVITELQASGARLCFIALGAPKQELFAARAQTVLPETGFLSIGAGLDFLAGTQKRAPRLTRLLALEWLWRLASNPRRMAGRYAACFAVLPDAVRMALAARQKT